MSKSRDFINAFFGTRAFVLGISILTTACSSQSTLPDRRECASNLNPERMSFSDSIESLLRSGNRNALSQMQTGETAHGLWGWDSWTLSRTRVATDRIRVDLVANGSQHSKPGPPAKHLPVHATPPGTTIGHRLSNCLREQKLLPGIQMVDACKSLEFSSLAVFEGRNYIDIEMCHVYPERIFVKIFFGDAEDPLSDQPLNQIRISFYEPQPSQ